MYLIVKRTINRVADWVLKNDIDNVQTLISSKKKPALIYYFNLECFQFTFIFDTILSNMSQVHWKMKK